MGRLGESCGSDARGCGLTPMWVWLDASVRVRMWQPGAGPPRAGTRRAVRQLRWARAGRASDGVEKDMMDVRGAWF